MADDGAPLLTTDGWLLKDLWEKYEEIAMRFNDLLLRLRTQALAGVAAVTAVVGLFGKDAAKETVSWELATGVFVLLAIFWVAIWVIDLCYYNRLLIGSVAAILDIESASKQSGRRLEINISTKIEAAVAGDIQPRREGQLLVAIKVFYGLVLAALIGGATLSFFQYRSAAQRVASKETRVSTVAGASKPIEPPKAIERPKVIDVPEGTGPLQQSVEASKPTNEK